MITLKLDTSERDIERAGEIIRSGGLVAFPTETVYGLGADALNAEAVASVYEAKGRPSDNPMIVHIADMEDLDNLLVDGGFFRMSPYAKILSRRMWPGPLTMVLPKSSSV
ncbi:MAG: L-threonylcarbamoyladenylate synthase, partial [Mogibacterium sp.]|nr:L-threonylcarbamoyladenylate synthase [Mogibacterium sp.]